MTKKKKKVNRQGPAKKVTLPVAAKMVYESLANIAWRVEKDKHRDASKDKPPITEEGFKHYILQELGKDAFLYSFTPSGEIGSGDSDHRSNPQTARIDKKFYEMFNELIGIDKQKEGIIVKNFRRDNAPNSVVKNRLFRFKSAIINLVELFLESNMNEYGSRKHMITDGRIYDEEGKRVRGIKSKFNKAKETSFSYKEKGNETPEEWFRYLLQIEMNRYLRVFVATFYIMVISDLFTTDINYMAKAIDALDLAGIAKEKNDKARFLKLKRPVNREEFIGAIKRSFIASGIVTPISDKSKKSVSGEQMQIGLFGDMEADQTIKKKKK
jgi:hypothetical protein